MQISSVAMYSVESRALRQRIGGPYSSLPERQKRVVVVELREAKGFVDQRDASL